ncbi:hypothetical protein FCV43_00225 [Vibrio genomosp. F6]|uniref:hypothetical protein n=1 Tax=Vibrio genomosp. F6 TaxID=723172 RepID=UPI00113657C1|nr:hypothetical protein [Vibrio genomosp. F6]TKF24667.1 hypothetical protein FCV43_00225 [Vibrio genomosp. F6]
MMKKIIFPVVVLSLSGCATSDLTYTPPVQKKVENNILLEEDFDVVWNRLVKNLASDFFVINNIEKSSRIINVSFSTNNASQYVDCGTSVRNFSNARGKHTYEYNPADSARYTFTNDNGHAFNAVRGSKLSGRTNIYLAPTESGTELSVNTKYVVDINVKYFNLNNQPAGSDQFSLDFSTKTPYESVDAVKCFAIGNLEQKVIEYAM